MYIHEFYYFNRRLNVEFSLKEDGDEFYRTIELEYDELINYYPDIIHEEDMREIDENFVIELLNGYFQENELPEQENL